MNRTWHILSADYPPAGGGVSDYTHLVSAGLAAAGDEVHVWCRRAERETPHVAGVTVHRVFDRISPRELRDVGRRLDEHPSPRRLLVQWVPHAFGYKSMNLPLCAWLWYRAHVRRDRVEVMVHEPFLSFFEGNWRQDAAALVHRVMIVLLLAAADRVWVSIPTWGKRLRPYLLRRKIPITWLPVPSNIPPVANAQDAAAARVELQIGQDVPLVGHFGMYDRHVTELLARVVPEVLRRAPEGSLLLMGRGSARWRDVLVGQHPELRDRVRVREDLTARDVSRHLLACDLLIQPYPDGVSSRRSSAMAALSHGRALVSNYGSLSEPMWLSCDAASIASVGGDMISAMIEACLRLIESPASRAALGQAAADLYRNRFDVSHTIEALRGSAFGAEPAAAQPPSAVRSIPCA